MIYIPGLITYLKIKINYLMRFISLKFVPRFRREIDAVRERYMLFDLRGSNHKKYAVEISTCCITIIVSFIMMKNSIFNPQL